MNCPNCGGPVDLEAAGDVLRCRFCRTARFVGSGDGPDGLLLTGPESQLPCPRGCGPLQGGRLDGAPVAACPVCRGLLMRFGNFGPVVADRRARWSGPDARPRPIDPDTLRVPADCPGCGRRMETHPYYGAGNTVIDSCDRCELVWLDCGEVAAIAQAPGRR